MKPQKILIINTKYRIFGGEDSNITDEITLLKKHFDVEYIEFNNSEPINIFDFVSFFVNSNILSNKRLKRLINEFNPDIAYVHNTWFKANLGIFKILKKENIKILHKIHNYRFDCARYLRSSKHLKKNLQCPACSIEKHKLGIYNKYYSESFVKSFFLNIYSKRYFKILKNNSISLLVLSNFQKKFLIDIGIHESKLFLYQNPIEINKKLLSEYNSSSKYVVFAGRLVDNKGINELLDVWTRLNSKNLILKIIGSGENDKFLLEKYDSPSIEFLGHLENNKVKELIQKSRAVVTGTKLFEGQPRVLFEASSYGVPSLYPSFGGMNDFFPQNYLFTFKQYDYDDLFIKMSNFENEELLNQESQRIIDHVSLNFSEEVLIGKFKKIMDNS